MHCPPPAPHQEGVYKIQLYLVVQTYIMIFRAIGIGGYHVNHAQQEQNKASVFRTLVVQ
jgi:hypothetical protein